MLTHTREKINDPKYVIGVDLDGTSGDFHKSFRNVLINKQGYDPELIPVRTPSIYSYVDAGCFPDMDTFMRSLNDATHQHVYLNMEPYEGFRKHLTGLYRDGAAIKIITSRPDDAMDDTIAWLEDVCKVPYHTITITHHKLDEDADVYLDDMPGHIEKMKQANKRAIIFDQPYNRGLTGERAKSWKEIHNLLV